MNINTDILNNIIIGRVEPHIYAFSTQTVPNYLKIGDTYRPVERRLDEWRRYFPNLEKMFADVAKVNDETYFRDFAVHAFLEQEKHLKRLLPDTIKNLPYYSKEFFEKASVNDIKEALADINKAFQMNNGKYQFYSFDESRVPITYTYQRTETYEPRPNQQDTIDRFKTAVANGRTNLLMYAVMRFGKSFTSMCCAAEMDVRLVIVVSAKADVKEEWKKTVESHTKFANYAFFDSDALSNRLKTNNVVVFLTLQDLMGDEIKAKHKEIFENEFDLLIVDESHYGARASEYGKVLNNLNKTQLKKELADADVADDFEDNETLKTLQAKVRLHLSGTPYRILMGSEFTQDDIIAFYQFTDIVKDQEAWDNENLQKDEVKEWDNPYFGFPQMIRFAFNPNESSAKKMEELKKDGITYAFSELFRPQSISKDGTGHKHQKFIHEPEILDLLEVIDGTKEDENVLGFLDFDKIKEGKMCRHIVCVLPYRASCDALEQLIKNNQSKFKNLNGYEIINIAGVDDERTYKETKSVKKKIKECESKDKKTLTLTVNCMLTGSTVEEWDTMMFLKDTASPQEYDQAIFRLQNQYVRKYTDDKGDAIKYNMKPQTLLVDFNPNRMFRLQEQKSQIYNVNIEKNGNSKLEDRIKDELRISPIILLNRNKLQEVEPADILNAVREYSTDKSVMDEATDIPTDFTLLSDETLRQEIESLSPIDAKKGIEVKAVTGDGDDLDTPDDGGNGNGDVEIPPVETPKQWNKKMLSDEHIFVVSYKPVTSEVFPNVSFEGGVAITYKDKEKVFGNIGQYSHYKELSTILKKVVDNNFISIINIIYLQAKFNLEYLYKDYPNYQNLIGSNGHEKRLTTNIFELLNVFGNNQKSKDDIEIFGLINNNERISRFIDKKYIEIYKNQKFYKVFLPKSNGSGAIGKVKPTPLIGEPFVDYPQTGCTQSFISFGKFGSLLETENTLKYIKTKFARTLLGTLKVTQDNNKETWANVPLQDFTANSDIDWSKSIAEIDRQLYTKYSLTDEEIGFVEGMIKEME